MSNKIYMDNNSTVIINGTVALYCRTAHKDDAEKSEIKMQQKLLANHAKESGFENLRFYSDDGYSSLNDQRPALSELMHDIKADDIKTVMAKDISRITRDMKYYFKWTDILESKSVRFITLDQKDQETLSGQENSKILNNANCLNLAIWGLRKESIS